MAERKELEVEVLGEEVKEFNLDVEREEELDPDSDRVITLDDRNSDIRLEEVSKWLSKWGFMSDSDMARVHIGQRTWPAFKYQEVVPKEKW